MVNNFFIYPGQKLKVTGNASTNGGSADGQIEVTIPYFNDQTIYMGWSMYISCI